MNPIHMLGFELIFKTILKQGAFHRLSKMKIPFQG